MNPTFQLIDSGWDKVIADAVATKCDEFCVVCPFIKVRAARRLLAAKRPNEIQVITRFHLGEMCAGVNDTEALRFLLKNGAKIRGVRGLHAKVYLFGDKRAIVTSANLTEAALLRNHEFGFITSDSNIIKRCQEYFDGLWTRAGDDLGLNQLEVWERRIEAARLNGAPPSSYSGLLDEGTDAGVSDTGIIVGSALAEVPQSFVKFFGEGRNRASLDTPVLDEVKGSGPHWACSYPKTKRPRQVKDGAVMFMGRLVMNPDDIMIYGRAIGVRHVPGRDEASPDEIKLRAWKAQWSNYVRVHHAEFIAGTLANGVRLSALMDELKSTSFVSTQKNTVRGSGNNNPRGAFRQQAQVQLSKDSFAWLSHRLDLAFAKHGKLTPAELETLDWPERELLELDAYVAWSIEREKLQENTAKQYAYFLKRCTAHYPEVINSRSVPDQNAADQMIARVMEIVQKRGRWTEGTFNKRDVSQNLTPALRAYGRFSEAKRLLSLSASNPA